MTTLSDLTPERIVYLSSLLVLSLCGLGVIAITSYCKVNKGSVQLALTRSLWKFESAENKKTLYNEKCWAWRKLVLAGIMIACLAASVFIKLYPPKITITLAAGVFVIWTIGILIYWYGFIAPASIFKHKDSDATSKRNESSSTMEGNPAVEAWMARKLDKSEMRDNRLPLTIVTGFLGSGKTTLVRNILQNTVGMRVLVIENEIGAEGIDHELLLQQTGKEEIILMNNGCVCCTVRKDILATFHKMFSHDAFANLDWVVIETTGMADPAPLIQSLYMDAECQARLRLDSVLTVVDSKHLPRHLRTPPAPKEPQPNGDTTGPLAGLSSVFRITTASATDKSPLPEAVLQITFADRILLNKTDLVTEAELGSIVQSVQKINPSAKLIACQNSNVPLDELLNIRAFDPLQNKALAEAATTAAAAAPQLIQVDAEGKIVKKKIQFGKNKRLQLSAAGEKIRSKHTVNTVSLVTDSPLDLDLFNAWITQLLAEKGTDLYRVKGILHMAGYDEQFVAHGVHMIFDGQRGRPWDEVATGTGHDTRGAAKARRYSRLVFIGLGIDNEALEKGFLACCAK